MKRILRPSFLTDSYPPRRYVHTYVKSRSSRACFSSSGVDLNSEDEAYLQGVLHGETENDKPWKTLLEMPARAAWRVTHPPASQDDPLERSRRFLLSRSHRKKDLHRAYKEVVEAQNSLRGRRERERLRLLQGRSYKPREVKKDAAIGPVLYGPVEALAAVQFRLIPNYHVTVRVLQEAKSLIAATATKKDWKPRRIIDFGMGCGSATAAALHVWSDTTTTASDHADGGYSTDSADELSSTASVITDTSIEWIHGIDSSKTMRESAELFLEQFCSDMPTPPRLTQSGHLSASAEASPPSFDLALCVYTAGELSHTASVLAAAGALWEKLLPGGILVVIEPGTPDGFSAIRGVRNMLLAVAPPHRDDNDKEEADAASEDECHIISPCTHNGECPIERYQQLVEERRSERKTQMTVPERDDDGDENESDADSDEDDTEDDVTADGLRTGFCSFVQTLPGASSRSKGEKFSYLVAQKRVRSVDGVNADVGNRSHPFQDDDLVALLDHSLVNPDEALASAVELERRYLDSDADNLGLELVSPESFGRIVSAPMKRRGHVYIETCAAPGELRRQRVSKSSSNVAPGIYQAARKSRWGGLFPMTKVLKEDKV